LEKKTGLGTSNAERKNARRHAGVSFDGVAFSSGDIENEYIFQEKAFCIDLKLSYVYNRLQAAQSAQDLGGVFSDPDLKLNLIFGGLFSDLAQKDTSRNESDMLSTDEFVDVFSEHYLSIAMNEKQMKALMHFVSFTNSYNNFRHGVLNKHFYGEDCKRFTEME